MLETQYRDLKEDIDQLGDRLRAGMDTMRSSQERDAAKLLTEVGAAETRLTTRIDAVETRFTQRLNIRRAWTIAALAVFVPAVSAAVGALVERL